MAAVMDNLITVDPQEAMVLGASDGVFWSNYFLPKTFRQGSPQFHYDIWNGLDNPANRYVSIQVFRGGAKTTLLRTFAARRVAYGISNTILYLGKSGAHATRSVEWLKKTIEFNSLYRDTFQLRPGDKWTGDEIEIWHGIDEYPIRILAAGITGSVRGINIDDFRPDLIILDDVLDEENTATPEQRNKLNALIFGAVKESLAPASESPHAKLVMLQTPLDGEDASELTMNDPEWHPMRYSVFDEKGESQWAQRWSTEVLEAEKASAARRNMLSIWMREKECKVIADEKRYFRLSQLTYWTVLPEGMVTAIGIDPSPPKDEDHVKRKKKDPDPEVLAVVGAYGKKRFLLEVVIINDPDPDATWSEFHRLQMTWKPRRAEVETVAYQKTLQWYLKKKMTENRCHIPIKARDDKRSKVKRIRQCFSSAGHDWDFYVNKKHEQFIDQFKNYPEVPHEDVLDAVEMALDALSGVLDENDYGDDIIASEEKTPEQVNWGAAP